MARRPLAPPKGFDILGWGTLAAIIGLYLGLDWLTRRQHA